MDDPTPDTGTSGSTGTEKPDVAERGPRAAGAPTLEHDAGKPIGPPPQPPSSRFRDLERPAPRPVVPLDPAAPETFRRPADTIGRPDRRQGPAPGAGRARPIFGGIAAGVLGAALTITALALAGAFDRPETIVEQVTAPSQPTPIIVEGDGSPATAAAVATKVVPSIVTVQVGSEGDNGFSPFASGSGVVLESTGLIVTNHHVIADADLTRIVLQNGAIYEAAVVGSDRITDLAVLRIDAPGLLPIELGSTDSLAIGEQAIAIGNPLGLPGGASVTVGVVSAFDREVTVSAEDRLFGMLQTDAPITRGSSGGALVDGRGRLIGITTAIGVTDAGAEGVGFAIPVELMSRITNEIIETGSVRHTFLGVLLQDHFDQADGARVPAGAEIVDFVEPSGAEEAGLQAGDRLTQINGRTVRTKEDIINELRTFRVGDTVTFAVVRDGATFSADVTLGERPDDL